MILGAGCETCLFDAAVVLTRLHVLRSATTRLRSNTSPKFEPDETTHNMVDIPNVQELVICCGNFRDSGRGHNPPETS